MYFNLGGVPMSGVLSAIKKDVEKAGSNRGKIFFIKGGNKSRVRFLDDMDDGRIIRVHDRWDPQLNVLCRKNKDEDADCEFCGMDGIRTRDQYAWAVWDYDAGEVKILMYPANQYSPVPGLVALYDAYGTITDRDFSISRSGSGTDTSYAVIPLDKGKFRNDKAKKLTDKAFWKILNAAFPYPQDEEDEDDGWDEEEEDKKSDNYDDKEPKDLYKLCRERDIKAKPKMKAKYYIDKLRKYDLENDSDGDDDFWGDDEDEEDD